MPVSGEAGSFDGSPSAQESFQGWLIADDAHPRASGVSHDTTTRLSSPKSGKQDDVCEEGPKVHTDILSAMVFLMHHQGKPRLDVPGQCGDDHACLRAGARTQTGILFTGKASFVGVAISRPILLTPSMVSLSGTFVHKNLKKPAYLGIRGAGWPENGPDHITNGIALTPTLHRLFDRHLFSLQYIGEELVVVTSNQLSGDMVQDSITGSWLKVEQGQQVRLPRGRRRHRTAAPTNAVERTERASASPRKRTGK